MSHDAPDAGPELPCIRCGDCAVACPVQLDPRQLLWDLRARQSSRAVGHGLLDCTECSRCDGVCPSRIALAARFGAAQDAVRVEASGRLVATAARDRYLKRNLRLQRDAEARAALESQLTANASAVDPVAAALERAKARRLPPGRPD